MNAQNAGPTAEIAARVATGLAAGIALGILHITPAAADLKFTLDVDGCSGGCSSPGIPHFATVLLHQVNANTVEVTETLFSGVKFIKQKGADGIEFDTKSGTSLSAITSGFKQDLSAAPTQLALPVNSHFAIACSGCGPIGADPIGGSLRFRASNPNGLSLTDFVANAGGYFFAADVVNMTTTLRLQPGIAGATSGKVRAGGPGVRVPEPASLTLLGTALAGLGLLLCRRWTA